MARKAKKATETSVETSASSSDLRCEEVFDQKSLAPIVKLMALVADTKSTMPMLARMLVRYSVTGTTLAATDLNVSLVADLPNIGGDRGGFAIDANDASNVIAKLPKGGITIKRSERFARISAGSIAVELETLPDRDFPKVPDATVDTAVWSEIDAHAFVAMINAVKHSVCKDETRFHLNGIHMETDDQRRFVMVTTDGHRLTRWVREIPGAPSIATGKIVPANALPAILKVIGKSEHAKVWFAPNHLFVRVGVYTLSVKYIDAQFPPVGQVIPKAPGKLACVDRQALLDALDRSMLMCSDTRGVKITIGNGSMRLTADDPDRGSMRETLPADGKAAADEKEFAIGTNPRYLMEALKAVTDERVMFSFDDELAPMLVRSFTDAVSYAFTDAPHMSVVMPMRV